MKFKFYIRHGLPVPSFKDNLAGLRLQVRSLKALKPNVVQSIENNVCMIHGGPFANIAHGCNSYMATKACMKLAEYTVTEARAAFINSRVHICLCDHRAL